MSFIDEAGRRRRELEDRHRPWRPLTLAGLLDRTAAQYPDRPFVIGEQAAFSYGQGRRALGAAGPRPGRPRRAAR